MRKLPNEPEYYGLSEAEFHSLPWEWILPVMIYLLAGALLAWMVHQDLKGNTP